MNWRPSTLPDPQVTHFRDTQQEAGRWFRSEVTHAQRKVEWDAYFVYPAGARWDSVPAPLSHWGRTVYGDREGLRHALLPLLGKRSRSTPPGSAGVPPAGLLRF
jgi:hypothetical protein